MAADDENEDFARAPATLVDQAVPGAVREPITAPHRVTAAQIDAAYTKGYKDCREDVVEAFKGVFRERGLTTEEIDHVVLSARSKMPVI